MFVFKKYETMCEYKKNINNLIIHENNHKTFFFEMHPFFFTILHVGKTHA